MFAGLPPLIAERACKKARPYGHNKVPDAGFSLDSRDITVMSITPLLEPRFIVSLIQRTEEHRISVCHDTRSARKLSSHFEYLEIPSRDLRLTRRSCDTTYKTKREKLSKVVSMTSGSKDL